MKAWKSNRFMRYELRSEPWQAWFAWRPVRTVSGRVVWWQTVYRKVANTYSDDMDMRWYFYGDEFDILKNFKNESI